MVFNRHQMCRVCLIENKPGTTDIQIQPIFNKDEENVEISTKLHICGGLIISNDEKPTGICRNCSEILHVSYNFRALCQNSDQKLNQLFNYPNKSYNFPKFGFDSSILSKLCKQMVEEHLTLTNKLFRASTLFPTYGVPNSKNGEVGLARVVIKEEVEEEEENKEHLNTELINSKNLLSDSILKRPKRRAVLKNRQKTQIEIFENINFDYVKDEKLEEKTMRSKNKKLNRKKEATEFGVADEIVAITKYNDNVCDNQDHLDDIKKGKRKYIRKKPRKHEPKLPPTLEELTCDICRNVFKNKKLLAVHVKLVHVGKKDFICETCGASFANQFKLLCHRHTHTGARPYPCRYCEKAFRNSSNRRVHEMRMHTHIKPFSCEFCGKDWHTSHQLKKHRRVHTGEKPYICSVCGTGFKARNHLNAHMKSLVPCIVKMNLKKQNEQINNAPPCILGAQNQAHDFQSMQTIQSSLQSPPPSSSIHAINSLNNHTLL